MRRHEKKEMLEVISSLEKISRMVIGNLDSGIMAAPETLIDCQNAALEVGNALESQAEPVDSIVHILEEYCENLYRISICLNDIRQCRKLMKRIQKQLAEVRNKITHELSDGKKEVVFLPYKASMWDSLESVWQAAVEDEDCEACVVPIPYFDKNSDGSLGEMHDEGNQYPEYVPVISWKEYDILQHHPDVIYIHNPYDDCNYVTTVHPDYYASKLRSYTDLLVYIPYFIAIDDAVDRHFCTAPGVLFAHKVIVQSEKVRQTYLKEIHKFEKQNNCRDVFGKAEDKIIALGSPKYDKVLNAKREDFKIPEGWKKLIVRSDGTDKKVILYNTTINSMLDQQEKMIKKIKDVLEVFRENTETVLLWRPHPLLKATLKSMRPKLLPAYEEIEEEYKNAGWGIFDDTSDLYRAISISDAYYGDMSSVVELYKQTGKPVMIQNTEVLNQNEDT